MSLANNAKWIAIGRVGSILIQLSGLAILARLLEPADYGVMAMATVVVNFLNLFRDMGTAAAVVQKPTINLEQLNSVFSINVFIGLFLTCMTLIGSQFLGYIFDAPGLSGLIVFLAPTFTILAATTTQQALFERSSEFRLLTEIEFSSGLVGLVAGVFSASLGAGAYSLAIQSLVTASCSALQLYTRSTWKPKIKLQHLELREFFGFSGHLSSFNFVNYLARNLDIVIIGRKLGAADLGNYSIAYRMMLFPLQSLTFVASRSMFPILSRHQFDSDSLRNTYFSALSAVVTFSAPICTGMWMLRTPGTALVFGDKWPLVADLLAWMAPVGFIQSIVSTTGTVFMAQGKTRLLFKLGCLGALLQVSGFAFGVAWGLMGVVIGYLLSNVVNAVIAMGILMNALKCEQWAWMSVISKPMLASFGMAIVIMPAQGALLHTNMPLWLSLMTIALAGAAVYLVLSYTVGILLVRRVVDEMLLKATSYKK